VLLTAEQQVKLALRNAQTESGQNVGSCSVEPRCRNASPSGRSVGEHTG
jgi:hypothetical protein